MRKASQSMYQPSAKQFDVAGSSLLRTGTQQNIGGQNINKSALIQAPAKMGLSYHNNNNSGVRKVDGYDMKTTQIAKPTFQATVNSLRNKPNKKAVEDEYINGLQQQIKYLEYELKLLKDKELMDREGVNQLDNFLKDQIPINENILAMKNKYNNIKANLENQFNDLSQKKARAEDVLATQKGQIKRLHQIIAAHRDQINRRKEEFKTKIAEITRQTTLTKSEYQQMQTDNKLKNTQIKQMSEEIAIISRTNQKQRIQEVRKLQENNKKNQKFQENFKTDTASLIQSQQKVQQLEELAQQNPLLAPLEQQNSSLRKKIMLNEKQRSTAENIIAQIDLFLKQQARERQIQRLQKNKQINLCEEYKNELQKLERDVQSLIREQTLRYKKLVLKDMANQLGSKDDHYDMLTDRLRSLQQECSNMIQERKELQQALAQLQTVEKEQKEKMKTLQNTIETSDSQRTSIERVLQQMIAQNAPLASEIQKSKNRLPILERAIEGKNKSIDYLNKQVELLKELKSLDLEQLQLISQGGSQVQNILNSFMKSWEKIKTL